MQDTKGWGNPMAEFLPSMPKALGLVPNPIGKSHTKQKAVRPRGLLKQYIQRVSGSTMQLVPEKPPLIECVVSNNNFVSQKAIMITPFLLHSDVDVDFLQISQAK